ncbi:MAG: 3,4-dihydroxy-2-butanone-4-phosphate synthase [Nanoarchaeota archaeon]|nr:3,4-dihydroxy-2-butanone-4-phosphate synthase [Nanoarchaeota archaeon]
MLSTIEEAITDLQRGRCIIVVDDENRENEGDLVLAAEKATPSKINFMIKKAGGLICVPMLGERLDQLNIPLMVQDSKNTEITRCKFTISVDYRYNTTTGISAQDRTETIKALIDEKSKPENFAMPGHIFPLRYEEGGILKREGHTEAAVDLCRLAGLYPAAVICEILNKDGEAAKLEELKEYTEKHNLKIISIQDLISYRKEKNI